MPLTVEIVTPAKVAWMGEVAELQAPGVLGEFGVLPGHASMLSVTRAGVVALHGAKDGASRLVVGPGFAEVGPDRVTLLVDSCVAAASVDKAAAAEALAAAEARQAAAAPGSADWDKASRDVELARARTEA